MFVKRKEKHVDSWLTSSIGSVQESRRRERIPNSWEIVKKGLRKLVDEGKLYEDDYERLLDELSRENDPEFLVLEFLEAAVGRGNYDTTKVDGYYVTLLWSEGCVSAIVYDGHSEYEAYSHCF